MSMDVSDPLIGNEDMSPLCILWLFDLSVPHSRPPHPYISVALGPRESILLWHLFSSM